MGELLRRYWHPVGLGADAGATPRAGEGPGRGPDPVPRRAGPAGPGLSALLPSRHDAVLRQGRGARHPLLLSRLAVRRRRPLPGACRASPNPAGPQCQRVRQPWYPVEERYGLVFAYLGPAGEEAGAAALRMPGGAGPGEFVEADDSSIGSGGIAIAPCNWLQHFENVVDPYHVPILHGTLQRHAVRRADGAHSQGEVRVRPARREGDVDRAPGRTASASAASTEAVAADPARRAQSARRRSYGMVEIDRLDLADRRHALPHLRRRPRARRRASSPSSSRATTARPGRELTPEEHQKFPGDAEAQVGQGADHLPFRGAPDVVRPGRRRCCADLLQKPGRDRRHRQATRSAWRSTRRAPT